ncbi:hypothetical protein COY28_03545 [Candidatus Woesearchaeota archaeon CG_4_10_14_0_2_um_filter_57_5]|nr:MAG: hypothetical protein AUJ68_03435 [Candidatus Woesearchaeota archaeon CG1_02_57_44]PIN70867.1 MAG: hypothetical protein COV94_00875 [Candidatus Woesearchaeota archaeon CG11_big_fil_rev_8_21_14_0_20_57_5]PIZ53487.1 MAG: hypothetical protein COY28_03545 [Candidatus Woesearchaeota archaeon CG_4_10_14_0_2_um_filter_57_5]
MKLAHLVRVTVFVKPEEDDVAVWQALLGLFPFDLAAQKIAVSQKTVIGFEEKKIRILTVELSRQKNINDFLAALMERLGEDGRRLLLSQAESRLDEGNHFFLRLLKPALLRGEYQLTDAGDCYHIKISVAAYPGTREQALESVKGIVGLGSGVAAASSV